MKSFVVGSFLLLAFAAFIEASHFRYGTVSFTRSGSAVTFTINLGMRRSYFGSPNQGTNLGAVGSFVVSGGSSYSPSWIVTNADVANDLIYASATITINLSGGSHYCYFSSSARISNLNNNANGAFTFGTTVLMSGNINNSPVSGVLPIVTIPYGKVPYSYQIVASDPENDALSFRLSTSSEMSGSQPTGLSVSSSGTVTLNSVLAHGYWSTQQTMIDSFGNTIAVDYLLNVVDTAHQCNGQCSSYGKSCTTNADCSCGACVDATPAIVTDAIGSGAPYTSNPVSPANGATVTLTPGQPNVVSFVAYDKNFAAGTTLVMSFAQLPSGAQSSGQSACDAAHGCTFVGNYATPQIISLTITPAFGAPTSTVCLGVTSNGNALPYSQHCVNLDTASSICGNNIVEAGEACDGGDCCDAQCNLRSSSYSCRPAASMCDVAEMCTGSSAACPADVFVSASAAVSCRSSAGPCDVAESCDGQSNQCPADSFQSSSVTCRASTAPCDAAEKCTGSSAACPADALASTSTVCRPANGVCDVDDYCDGVSSACTIDRVANTTQCQTAAYICPRVQHINSAYPNSEYFCNSLNPGVFMMCYTQVANGQNYNTFIDMQCSAGTGCNCPYGTECSCNGMGSPCQAIGTPHTC